MSAEARLAGRLHRFTWLALAILGGGLLLIQAMYRLNTDGYGWPWIYYERANYDLTGRMTSPHAWYVRLLLWNLAVVAGCTCGFAAILEFLQRRIVRHDLITFLKLRIPTLVFLTLTASMLLWLNLRARDPEVLWQLCVQEYGWPFTCLFAGSLWPPRDPAIWKLGGLAANISVGLGILILVTFVCEGYLKIRTHLSTALVLMIVTGLLIGANVSAYQIELSDHPYGEMAAGNEGIYRVYVRGWPVYYHFPVIDQWMTGRIVANVMLCLLFLFGVHQLCEALIHLRRQAATGPI